MKETTYRKGKMPMEQKERLTAYLMRRYPCIKKIKIGSNAARAYTVRVHYKDERNRTFITFAYTYETLIVRAVDIFTSRGVAHA